MRLALCMLISAVFCGLLCLCAGPALAAEQEIARVIAFSPDASAKGPAGSRALAMKAPIYAQDEIITGPNGMVQLIFNDETTMTLSADASAAMKDFVFDEAGAGKPAFSMNLGKGMARMVTGEIVKRNPDGFAVTTPHGTIGIRGTGFSLHVDAHRTLLLSFQMTPGHDIIARNSATGKVTTLDRTDMAVELRPEGTTKRPATPEELDSSQFSVRPAVPNAPQGGSAASRGQGGSAPQGNQGGHMALGNGQELLPQGLDLSDALREQQFNPQKAQAEMTTLTTLTAFSGAIVGAENDGQIPFIWSGTLNFTANLDTGAISDGAFALQGDMEPQYGNDSAAIFGSGGSGSLNTADSFTVNNFTSITGNWNGNAITFGNANFGGTINRADSSATVKEMEVNVREDQNILHTIEVN